VGLERGPFSLVRIIEELLEWKRSGSGQENRINGRRDPLCWPRDPLYPRKLAETSPKSGGRTVGIVRLRTKGHGVQFFFCFKRNSLCVDGISFLIKSNFLCHPKVVCMFVMK
jgi:hypothetical protein